LQRVWDYKFVGDISLTEKSMNMKTLVPNYYSAFHCIAGACKHTCCVGWEIDVDEESLQRFSSDPWIAPHLDCTDVPHLRLQEGERCPFLRQDGLCEMIVQKGEESLCQICRDHPRFRNFWTGVEEIGLGMVCEAAAELMLSQSEPMRLAVLHDDGDTEPLPPDEQELWDLRERLWKSITETGPRARLKEYLIYRYVPDALYDGRLSARLHWIDSAFEAITAKWAETSGTMDEFVECVRQWSYDAEYDDEVPERQLCEFEKCDDGTKWDC